MKISSQDFRVRSGDKVKLTDWPTIVKPFCESKKDYQVLLGEHIEKLSSYRRIGCQLPLSHRHLFAF
jgi:hypothetical protein